ncbi:hypothetical protein Tco_1344160 [Tanacetum coccineum]
MQSMRSAPVTGPPFLDTCHNHPCGTLKTSAQHRLYPRQAGWRGKLSRPGSVRGRGDIAMKVARFQIATILLMAIPKEHLRRFHGMDDAKEIWEAIRTRFGGNANSKKMQKAVLKQQFEAFSISSSEGLEKGYDRFQQLLSQLEAHGAEVSTEDANHKFSQI